MRPIQPLALLAVLSLCAASLQACPVVDDDDSSDDRLSTEPESMIIHIKTGTDESDTDEAHTVLMAMNMARVQAEAGRDVLVHFDILGPVVVLEGVDFTFPSFPSSTELLDMLIALDVRVQVCPGCLAAEGYDVSEVREGVELAGPNTFFEFTRGRVVTLDY